MTRRGLRPPRHQSVAGAVLAFGAAGLASVLVIGLLVAWMVRRDATENTIREARDLTISEGRTAIAPVLQDGLLTGEPAAVAAIDDVVRNRLLSDRVVRVKIWSADGTVLYSDFPGVVGSASSSMPRSSRRSPPDPRTPNAPTSPVRRT